VRVKLFTFLISVFGGMKWSASHLVKKTLHFHKPSYRLEMKPPYLGPRVCWCAVWPGILHISWIFTHEMTIDEYGWNDGWQGTTEELWEGQKPCSDVTFSAKTLSWSHLDWTCVSKVRSQCLATWAVASLLMNQKSEHGNFRNRPTILEVLKFSLTLKLMTHTLYIYMKNFSLLLTSHHLNMKIHYYSIKVSAVAVNPIKYIPINTSIGIRF
jgi:hypothetical protein